MNLEADDMPKLESPFIKENVNSAYVCLPKINPGYEWVFEDSTMVDKLHGNPYKLEKHLWIQFSYLQKKFKIRYWDEFIKEFKGLGEKEVYEKMSDFMGAYWSPFARRWANDVEPKVDKNTPIFKNLAGEGVVFYSPDGKMAKLRRDMFDWYKGVRH